MREPDDCGAEYSIQVSAVVDAKRSGYLARVVVKKLPAMLEVFRDEVLTCGQTWPQPQSALAAALARGQQFVRFELRRPVLDDAGGEPGERQSAPDSDEAMVAGFQPVGERGAGR
ncbi:hypothetical protein [Methylibium sp.]|uniref:hypothetical protein n=1 Tax=Methylibium sp. TaxID=2067992 RepID=UPI003D0BC43B